MAHHINLINLDTESHALLAKLLSSSNKNSFEAGSYQIDDKEIILSHKIIKHLNSNSTKNVYEVLDNEVYAKGCFGELYLSLVTLSFEEEKLLVKIKPEDKQRLVKAQQLKYVSRESAEKEAKNLRTIGFFHSKPLSSDENQTYITMRRLPGVPLIKLIEDNKLTIQERYFLTKALVVALKEQIFEQGLIHRDINPGNILIDDKFVARFIDLAFAITKNFDDSKEHHGAIPYAAPECYSLYEWSTVKTDIYALGRVLMLLWGDDMYVNSDYRPTDVLITAKYPSFGTLFSRMEEIPSCHAEIKALLRSMLYCDQVDRPDLDEILSILLSFANKLDPIPNPNKPKKISAPTVNANKAEPIEDNYSSTEKVERSTWYEDDDSQGYNDYYGFNNS
ncbi:protein kinase domain-containing protein [Legionella cardiaca]|uniref:Protein kinase n=1 Tax=Legionella cardiaca TaxID=1071983 RepID=A0ABY8ATD9_9GAMM|nr:protein kinase [Legionella cardiaca]WED42606.1 protein kinase [Legionella cardiaca]